MNGVIIVDKPAGWTSHDVVSRMRRILHQKSIGHLGTLDPLATGVLPLVTGSLTRLAQFYVASEKTYEGVIRFGFATNTYDADGEPVAVPVATAAACPDLNLPELQSLAAQFLGHIEQIPPPFSAKKIHGVPAYKLARKQKEVILKPVPVEIKEFTIASVDSDRAHFRARVSSGTYMRSIAHEMGQRLGCGAHLASLRRTALAEFTISQAHTLEMIERQMNGNRSDQSGVSTPEKEKIDPDSRSDQSFAFTPEKENINPDCHSDRSFPFPAGKGSGVEEPAVPAATQPVWGGHSCPPLATPALSDLTSLFIHPRQLLPHFPSVTADEPTAARIRSGRPVNLPDLSRAPQIKVFSSQTTLLAIATRIAGTLFHPKIVFPSD
jgi:tRNA pseudouridine55 synthase